MLMAAPFRYRRVKTIGNFAGRRVAGGTSMSKDELIIQLVKIGLGLLLGGYFIWWSLEMLQRLPPPH
jgi:hypothetical protein